MESSNGFVVTMLAPCGITCTACYVHLRRKNPCPGCLSQGNLKPQHCQTCKIAACASQRNLRFCGECPDFLCTLLKRLDKSYRQRYQVSLIENLRLLQASGVVAYLRSEQRRWTCPNCAGVVSLHDRICSICGRQCT